MRTVLGRARPVIRPGQMTGEHVLGSLVPFEADQRHGSQMRLASRNEGGVQCVGLLTRCRARRPLAVLKINATERILSRNNFRVASMHPIPRACHEHDAQNGCAHALFHARAFLQCLIKFIDAFGIDQIEIERAQLSTVGKLVPQHHVQCPQVLRARALRNFLTGAAQLVARDQPRQRAKSRLEINILALTASSAPSIEVLVEFIRPRNRKCVILAKSIAVTCSR